MQKGFFPTQDSFLNLTTRAAIAKVKKERWRRNSSLVRRLMNETPMLKFYLVVDKIHYGMISYLISH